MQPNSKETGDFYVWEVPGQPVVVHLHLGLVDRISTEVMRGFGAVPKRGAEVGGLLLGSIEMPAGEGPAIVRIIDFEPVPCAYRMGPSYLFSDEESHLFEAAAERWRPREAPATCAVGYFRSNTREGMQLGAEDIQLLEHFFPSAENVALLIQPYATRVSMAGFFVREGDHFPEQTPLEFPFRRRELSGEEAAPRRSMFERKPRQRGEPPAREPYRHEGQPLANSYMDGPAAGQSDYAEAYPESYEDDLATRQTAGEEPVGNGDRSRWVWIPLSTIFLIVGIVIGVWATMNIAPQVAESSVAQGFTLNLSVSRTGDNLTVRWNREAPAVQAAQKGVLEIEDGGYSKQVDLQQADLQNGTVIYQASSNAVRFRLVLYLDSRLTVAESLNWGQ